MAEYAHIVDGSIHMLVDLDPSICQAWVQAGNPKADAYRPVVNDPNPIYDPTIQVVEESLYVEAKRVRRAWSVRPKTVDELRRIWTPYEFLRRFSSGERNAIRVASVNDGAVADLMMFLQTATEVVSDDTTTQVGMDYLVHLGILTPARRAEIMS